MFKKFSYFLLAICCVSLTYGNGRNGAISLKGESISIEDSTKSKKVEEKDAIDLLRSLRKNKGKKHHSEKKSRVLYSFVPAVGYTLSTGFVGLLSANAAFYLSDSSTTNISSVSTSFNYSQYHQITVPVLANIWSKDNLYNASIDWRYFKYPQDTYGLGSDSRAEDADRLSYSHIRLHQAVLRKVSGSFYLGGGYMLDKRWKIKEEGSNEDVLEYGLSPKSTSSGFLLAALYDNRKNSINPLKGFFGNIRYRNNLTFLGGNTNWQSLTLDFRKYFNFPAGSQNTIALWNYNWFTLAGKPPYLDLPSTSWDPTNNTGRGYIQGRFRSPQMMYFEAEYRFSLTQNGLLGGVVFGNAQGFSNWPSSKIGKFSPGTGIGLRIKVNKASRTNIAIDYGFGLKGSRGLFVNLGEVF